jgi:putative transposase
VPKGLTRYYHTGDLHYITCSCYQLRPWLNSTRRRDLFLRVLQPTRERYRFVVVAYVIMPEHFHLLMTEPQIGNPSTVMQVVKQRYAQRLLARKRRKQIPAQGTLWEVAPRHVWQARFYDCNVWTEPKRIEKLRYMHRNPVKRGLVALPEPWRWSSFRCYMYGETGLVRINDTRVTHMRTRVSNRIRCRHPPLAKSARSGAPQRKKGGPPAWTSGQLYR